ncbi:MAG: hypothetical protein ACTHK3_12990 [Solirubrobacterales bacterium]
MTTEKPGAVFIVAIAAALSLAACGGGSGDGPTSTTTAEAPSPSRHGVPVAPLAVSGGGSAQFHVKGGDNSIQDYGAEAADSELRQAAEATHSFLVAHVRGEWARACGLLAASEQESIRKAAARYPQLHGEGCAAGLAAFAPRPSGSEAREITRVDAASLRHEGEQAFLLYVGAPEGTVYAMPLRLEGGAWKPAALSGAALPGVHANRPGLP